MAIFNFNDLSKQSKIGYTALYNVVLAHSTSFNAKNVVDRFTVPLCLNSENKVILTEKNFIFFESVLSELKLYGYYTIVQNNGRAVDETKTDFATVEIVISRTAEEIAKIIPTDRKQFNFSDVDTSKLLKRDGKAEKVKTAENTAKKNADAEKVATAEKIIAESVSADAELKNENKALKASADKFNAEVEKDNAEILQNCIKSYTEMICKLFGDDVDKEQKKAVAKMLSNFAVAISE